MTTSDPSRLYTGATIVAGRLPKRLVCGLARALALLPSGFNLSAGRPAPHVSAHITWLVRKTRRCCGRHSQLTLIKSHQGLRDWVFFFDCTPIVLRVSWDTRPPLSRLLGNTTVTGEHLCNPAYSPPPHKCSWWSCSIWQMGCCLSEPVEGKTQALIKFAHLNNQTY